MERPGNRQRRLPESERAAAARSRVASVARAARVSGTWPGPRLAVAGVRLIPAVVRALGRGGQQGYQVSLGLVGHAHDVGRRERQRLRGRPAAIGHHRALGYLDGIPDARRRLAIRRRLSRGGVHHQHPGRFGGGRIENVDKLRAGRRDGVQLARGAARYRRARQELLAEFGEPVHRRLRRLRHRVGLLPRLARGRPRRQELRIFARIDRVGVEVRVVDTAIKVDQRIALEPGAVPAGVLVDEDRRRPDVLARPAIHEVGAGAADDNRVFFADNAHQIEVRPLHPECDPGVGPLDDRGAARADVLLRARPDIERNIPCQSGGQTPRRAAHNPHSIASA